MSKRTDNIGSLSRNRKKESEKHPDFKGSCIVAGVEYWISSYINEGEGGGKYFRLYFSPKDASKTAAAESLDDMPDIPF